ncbi:hypothetical protein [Ruminococcus champanellensis]|uniref:hypothetical protein n=1 Tax=Ruminococcus champanellensis TaxID=1161942 RepID=UPI00059E5E0E|nr:hypothetical protein [Ruminococcus champanellensis]
MSTLFFYTKSQFFNFKSVQTAAGFEFLSMSRLLSSQKIDELDEDQQYYIDISSMVGFVKANDSQLFSFEQLFENFGENINFICDISYEKDIRYIFRYVFTEFSYVEAESDETTVEDQEKTEAKSLAVKKITDLDDSEVEIFLQALMKDYTDMNALRKSLKNLLLRLEYLINWENIKSFLSF